MQLEIIPIDSSHNLAICKIIQQVGAEFGAIGDGFGPSDDEVLAMSEHYHPDQGSQYFIALIDGKVVGGGGIAQFGSEPDCCELRKLFLLAETRGSGLGRKLASTCLDFAKEQGYQSCYLDTLKTMTSAIKLYESLGFNRLASPKAGTEHNGCDVWMEKRF